MEPTPTIDPNNFSRVAIALDRWAKTGALLANVLERTGASTHLSTVRALQDGVSKLQSLISHLKG